MSTTVERDTVATIRAALLIGLESYGEIERLQNAVKLRKICNSETPDDLVPIHPTGDAGTVSQFAIALRLLEGLDSDGTD